MVLAVVPKAKLAENLEVFERASGVSSAPTADDQVQQALDRAPFTVPECQTRVDVFPELRDGKIDEVYAGEQPMIGNRGPVELKLSKEEAAAVVATDPDVHPAGYGLGRHGWIALDLPAPDEERWPSGAPLAAVLRLVNRVSMRPSSVPRSGFGEVVRAARAPASLRVSVPGPGHPNRACRCRNDCCRKGLRRPAGLVSFGCSPGRTQLSPRLTITFDGTPVAIDWGAIDVVPERQSVRLTFTIAQPPPGRTPLRPGQPGNALKPGFEPRAGEPLIVKSVNSAFIGTDLEGRLRQMGARSLVVLGIQTNYCVASTARMAGNLGYKTYVVGDACATFPQRLLDGSEVPAKAAHDLALAELHGEFATVVATADVLAALRRQPTRPSAPK